ncbi:DUF5134 domain-containing protein [Streptomyces lydicus]|uniref:DUF5134 domain-containing protein n=1 Tax=Streptomyces lydicus TaxID=47763 RepID=UPI0037B4CE33
MHGPPLVGWLLVLLCTGAGVYCLALAHRAPSGQRAETRGEALMALGMAAMALPASAVAPPAWWPWLFTAAFGAAGLWALVRRHLHHAVGAGAMVYMALVMVGPSGAMEHMPHMGGTGPEDQVSRLDQAHQVGQLGQAGALGSVAHSAPGGLPLLTGLLLAYYTVYVIGAGVRLVPGAASAVAEPALPEGPVTNEPVTGGPVRHGPVTGGSARRGGPVPAAGAWPAGVLRACRVAMGIGMLAMLLAV